MTHIVGGSPTMAESEKIANLMLESGVGFLEIQIPFSDPVADGPTIMAANKTALDNGITPKDCLDLLGRLKKKCQTPILLMGYFNVVFRYGVEEFCRDAAAAGAYGLIIPDVSIDEEPYEHFIAACQKYGLHPIQVVSPITPDQRLARIGAIASGFVYCVARKGITGVESSAETDLNAYLKRVRKYIDLPLAVGFGISSKKGIERVLKDADVAVIGSHVINLYNEGELAAVETFLDSVAT